MANRNVSGKLILRNDTSTNWINSSIILSKGEVGLETDTMRLKVGDGTSGWNDLSYYYDNEVIKIVKFNGAFTAGGWSATAPYTQTITVNGLKNVMDSLVVVDVLLSGTQEQQNIQEQAYGKVLRYDTGENTLTATCRDDKPVDNFTIQGYYGIYISGNGIGGSGGPGSGIEEAPIDGKIYGRKDSSWTEVVSGGEGNVVSVDGIEPDAQGNVVLGAAKQTDLSSHTANATVHITSTERTNWNGAITKANAAATQVDLSAHTGNNVVHITSAERTQWNGAATQASLTTHTGDTAIHTSAADKTKLETAATQAAAAAKATDLTTHTNNNTIHITSTERTKWDNAATAVGAAATQANLTTHTSNADIHVIAADKTKWNTASTQAASAATQIALAAHTDDAVIHVTSTDKTNWNGAVTKANAAATLTSLTTHTNNEDIHVIATDKTKWNTASTQAAAAATQVNLTAHTGDATIHVTGTDKTNWNNAVTVAGAAIPKADIVNALNDTSSTKPLSAAQGKILNDTKIADAPSDGKIYNRRNASWIEATTGLTEAPIDGKFYARKSSSWQPIPDFIPKPDTTELTEGNLAIWSADGELFDAGQSPIELRNSIITQALNQFNVQRPDAPTDGQLYGRRSGTWAVISGTQSSIVFSSTQPSNPTEGMLWLKPV